MAKFTILDLMNNKSRAEVRDYTEIWLSPYEVREAHKNTRKECRDIERLADSFLLIGQEQPTILARINDEYWIVDGHRRNRANILNIERGYSQYEKVRYFFRDMSEMMYELSLLAGNGYTQDLTDYEKVELAARLKTALEKARDAGEVELTGRVRDIVGEIIGEKPTNMARIEKINNNLTEEAKEQFRDGKIGISAAYETAKLSEKEQKEIAKSVAAGKEVKTKDIAEKVREKQEEKRIQAAAERAEKAAKKAQDMAIRAAQSTVQSEQAAENADMSRNENPPVSELDTKETWTKEEWAVYTLKQLLELSDQLTEEELIKLQVILISAEERKETCKI